MTGIALDANVRCSEREIRLQIMVKVPCLPINRVVTLAAVSAEPIGMRVSIRMTVHTVIRGISVYL